MPRRNTAKTTGIGGNGCMTSIGTAWDELMGASLLKKLAVVADCATILGVSLATVVVIGGELLSEALNRPFEPVHLISYLLVHMLYFAAFAIALAKLLHGCRNAWRTNHRRWSIALLVSALVAMWFLLVCLQPWRNVAGGFLRNPYLLPRRPAACVVGVEASAVSTGSGRNPDITGRLKFNKSSDPSQYLLVAYVKYSDSSDYIPHRFYRGDRTWTEHWEVDVGMDGSFRVPDLLMAKTTVGNRLTDCWIVIVLRKDTSFPWHLPVSILSFPSPQLDLIGAVAHRIEIPATIDEQ